MIILHIRQYLKCNTDQLVQIKYGKSNPKLNFLDIIFLMQLSLGNKKTFVPNDTCEK